MKTVRFETLGCRLNQIESEATAKYFIDQGFSVSLEGLTSKTEEDSDTLLCVINTCTVTQKAEQKARRIIRLCVKKFPNAVVLVTGCYAQLASKEIKDISERICVIGGQIKSRIVAVPKLLKDNEDNFDPLSFIEILNKEVVNPPQAKLTFPENSFKLSTSSFLAHSRASLKIQDGCNNNCYYCAIHMARGHSVSIDVQTAIDRVIELENAGQEEVVLTTVNIGQYRGFYNGEYLNFSKLLVKLLENTKTINFRISSLYPEIVDDEFCNAIKDSRVRPSFHLSVQSGSDKILESMNRAYKAREVVKACDLIRSVKDNPFIACDIITGFPGETDDDFNQTMELCYRCDFSWVHAFPYSERPGTVAATMKHKVPQSISGERCKFRTTWAKNNKIKYINSYVGKPLSAILETVKCPAIFKTAQSKVVYHAVTSNFLHCEIETSEQFEGSQSVTVEILKPLEDRIEKGGEIEAVAKILRKN